jgi:hypothetical protein
MQDLSLYHNAILKHNYLFVRNQDFYKEFLWTQYLKEVSPKERAKLESFYKVLAVVSSTRVVEPNPTIPATWENLGSYIDAATQLPFTDYKWITEQGTALISLAKGASVDIAQQAVDKLFNLKGSGCVDYPDVQGVRISEYSYNELKTSCLSSRSIARMQFYSSFSAKETLEILKGSADEPSEENIIEALRPCFVLKYKDHVFGDRFYCRIKPAEMVRVKYRTPTGETKNPCWDASTIIGNLTPEQLNKRLIDPNWSLLMIEGEKKAAMLAQMALDKNLQLHVISLPGVWMGVAGPKKNRRLVSEIAQFQMATPDGKSRKCLIFFDNDKAFNAAVMDALLQTAGVLQKEGARVYIPHLPFGKKQKGADDYALIACQTPTGIDFTPLIRIIDEAVLIPKPPPLVKYPTEDQKRNIARFLEEAEHIDDLQKQVAKEGISSAKLEQLFTMLAPSLLKLPSEEVALQLLRGQDEKGRLSLLNIVIGTNPALPQLKAACSGIPDVATGTRFGDN